MTFIPQISHLVPVDSGGVGNEEIVVSVSLSLNLSGGSFSIKGIKGELPQPARRTLLSFSNGLIGVIEESPGFEYSSGGLVDTIGGRLSPFRAQEYVAWAFVANPAAGITTTTLSTAASALGISYLCQDFPIRQFSFGGKRVEAASQLANAVGGDVLVYKGGIYVVPKGFTFGSYTVDPSLIQSLSQKTTSQYSQSIASAKVPVNFDFRTFIYDRDHSRSQGGFVVEAGTKSGKFVQIPDGWIVIGDYEEWQPAVDSTGKVTDNSNPKASVNQYWKIFPSPSKPGFMRGIKSFSRLIRDLKLNNIQPGTVLQGRLNVSPFVAYTDSGSLNPDPSNPANNLLGIDGSTSQAEFTGFNVGEYQGKDIITDKDFHVMEGLALLRRGGSSDASSEYWYINMSELRTFPLVTPIQYVSAYDANDPTSPTFLGANVRLVSAPLGISQAHNDYYAQQLQLAARDRQITSISIMDDGAIPFPQPGDALYFKGAFLGRITSSSKNQSPGGSAYSVTSERIL